MEENKFTVTVCAILVIVAVAVSVNRTLARIHAQRYGEGHAIGYTRIELAQVGGAIDFLTEIEHIDLAAESKNGVVIMSGSELYRALERSTEAFAMMRPESQWVRFKSIRDRWGNEIHAEFVRKGDTETVRLWSDGLNQKNEEGAGDDIVHKFTVKTQKQPREAATAK